ncbi:MAG: hypothetical protein ABFC24_08390 [Methanoregulaceae archaeon]
MVAVAHNDLPGFPAGRERLSAEFIQILPGKSAAENNVWIPLIPLKSIKKTFSG